MIKVGDKVKCINEELYDNILTTEKKYKDLVDIEKIANAGDFKSLDKDDFIKVSEKNENIDIYDSIITELRNIYVAKNNDYGNSVSNTYELFGDISFATRINDKISRANTLITKDNQQVKDEKLEDTIKDMVNYGILWLIERERIKENVE